nr:MAG TPA: hypothetical protein [Caudoviricetes sp.]
MRLDATSSLLIATIATVIVPLAYRMLAGEAGRMKMLEACR